MTAVSAAWTGSSVGASPAPGRSTRDVRLAVYAVQGALDTAALTAAFLAAAALRQTGAAETVFPLIAVPTFLLAGLSGRLYSVDALTDFGVAAARVTLALTATLGLTLLALFAFKESATFSRVVFFTGAGLGLPLLLLVRAPVVAVVNRRLGRRFYRRLLVLDGTDLVVPAIFDVLDARAEGLRPDTHDPLMLHAFSMAIGGADRVVVSCPPESRENWSLYLKATACAGEILVPELHGIAPLHHEEHLGLVGITVSAGPLDLRTRLIKRSFDLAVTVPAILLLSPVLLLVAIAVTLDSPGPILFRQRRMGRANRLFDVYKFRTMRHELSDRDGHRSTAPGDHRITRVGRLLRSTSLDELPQLFNVLEGDMGLVGPRPHALGSTAGDELFWRIDSRYWLRHAIKPGITGLAQVRGLRGTTDKRCDLEQRLQSDLEYVSDWSLLTDIGILARTAMVLVHARAY